MDTGRLEAFTDGVLAIVITIMVLETKTPDGYDLPAIWASAPAFLAYALSYFNVGIVWNNHHHIMQATERVDGRALWANLFLLFWVSLIPLMIRWMNETHFAAPPTAAYGVALALVTIAYILFEKALIACNGADSKLAKAVGAEWKEWLTLAAYVVAAGFAFVSPWIALALYIAIALSWFIPDRRIEAIL
ncbi:TMEM175 family protein [Methylocapsa sp. S129]|uniref:TMEM175 family protein n=1 Tax=Methylocapsa sp. S129 TaxID=1641869 RepID=UPI00131AAFCE|nr:TMEM175 family protein [Methylocapsa sp. S129]